MKIILPILLFCFALCPASPKIFASGQVPLHAAPFEVAPVIAELPADDPLLKDAVPVLDATSTERPQRQVPWHWVVLESDFRGYIASEDWNRGEPRSGARIHSAPDFESPVLRQGRGLPTEIRAIDEVGPFTQVAFRAELPLFFDPVADLTIRVPEVDEETATEEAEDPVIVLEKAEVVEAPAEPAEPQRPDRPSPRTRASEEPVAEDPVDRAPSVVVEEAPRPPSRRGPALEGDSPGAPLRILQGRIVESRSLGIRRPPYRFILVSAAGAPIAFVDVSMLLTSRPMDLLDRNVKVYGELRPFDHRRVRTVVLARSMRPN